MAGKITVEKDGRYAAVKMDGVTEFVVIGGRGMAYVNAMAVGDSGHVAEVFAARIKKYLHKKSAMTMGVDFAKAALAAWGSGTEYVTKRESLGVTPHAMVDPKAMARELTTNLYDRKG